MKTFEEIYNSIINRFNKYTNSKINKLSVLNFIFLSISSVLEEVYIYIKDNLNPYLFSKLSGENLDKWGYGVNLPRKENESDINYKYRLKNWTLINEKSNNTAVDAALLNTVKAESITHIPFTNGTGTATIYVLPKEYTDENIKESLEEAANLIKDVISPSIYIDYIVPKIKEVSIYINYLFNENADIDNIKTNIYNKFKTYINSLAPGDSIYVGELNKIGIEENLVEYFSVSNFVVDEENINSFSIQQDIYTKLLLKEIVWVEVNF